MILFCWMTNSPPVGILCLLAEVRRQMLHAWRLEIQHPHSGERLRFEAPLPDDMERLIAALTDRGLEAEAGS